MIVQFFRVSLFLYPKNYMMLTKIYNDYKGDNSVMKKCLVMFCFIGIQCSYASFDRYQAIAHLYDKGRPDYPANTIAELVEKLSLKSGDIVLDLAAGTGKLTRELVQYNLNIIAVEPVENMRIMFSKNFPEIAILDGSAELIPLPSASVDAVVVGTAFHWFSGEKSLAEIARVLKPNGKLGLIWNLFNNEIAWAKEVRDHLDFYGHFDMHDDLKWLPPFSTTKNFDQLHHQTFRYTYPGTKDDVIARVLSGKIMGIIPEEQKQEVLDRVNATLATYAETRDKEEFDIPYRVELYWCFKN